jgi:hypothetical protein
VIKDVGKRFLCCLRKSIDDPGGSTLTTPLLLALPPFSFLLLLLVTIMACFKLSSYRRNVTTFWFLGVINNLAYVVVNSAAKSLADGFGQSRMIGLILWCNIAFGIVARFGNTFLLEVLILPTALFSPSTSSPLNFSLSLLPYFPLLLPSSFSTPPYLIHPFFLKFILLFAYRDVGMDGELW